MTLSSDVYNIVKALGQSNRVCQVSLVRLTDRQLEEVVAAMQVPFPMLTLLQLFSDGETPPVDLDSFLGGSASHLRVIESDGIPFPGLPKLLLSATHLLHLELSNIPHSGYISPEAMAALLAVLSSLETLCLEFQSPQSRPDWVNRRPPPSKRSVIPALERFHFKGVVKYLEDLVTFIDVPQLKHSKITFTNQNDFDGPRLAQFISRTQTLKHDAHVQFGGDTAGVQLSLGPGAFEINIYSIGPDRQVSSVTRVCNSCLPPLSMIEDLYIDYRYSGGVWMNGVSEWLELLLLFPAVKNLYLSKIFAPRIVTALQEIVGTEVLPNLQKIILELEPLGRFQKNIEQFVAARELSGHSITISVRDRSWI